MKISRELNLQKAAMLTIVINVMQLLAAVGAFLLSLFTQGHAFTGKIETFLMAGIGLVVCWGAVLDIREALRARRVGQEADALENALAMLEKQQVTLRAQRHDFMNHLQVVYSLLELEEYPSANEYIERVYADIKRVNRSLKTAIAAVNALLAAKMSDCEGRGMALELNIESAWEDLPVPGWEACRMLGNLIDNAMDALEGTPDARIRVELSEDLHEFSFEVSNNGPMIPDTLREMIFHSGFSTKGTGRGMGLAIVREIARRHGGDLTMRSEEAETAFRVTLSKPAMGARAQEGSFHEV